MKKSLFTVFFIFVVVSPWSAIFVSNFSFLFPPKEEILLPSDLNLVHQINTLRGEMNEAGIPPHLGRLIVNKFSFYAFQLTSRYLEAFDPQYLFFLGDISLLKSTKASGPIYLSFLPLFIMGYLSYKKRKSLIIFSILFLLTPIPASFLKAHYETLYRIPFFILLTFLASKGFLEIFKKGKKKVFSYFLVFLLIFEVFRFYHDFFAHYPRRLSENTIIKEEAKK